MRAAPVSTRDRAWIMRELTRPFPTKYIHENPSGDGSYIKHHVVEQRMVQIFGCPPEFECKQVIYGDVDAIPPDPNGRSKRAKEGRPALKQVVVAVIARLSINVEGDDWVIEEVGDCEQPHNWKTDGQRLKDAMSDAYKRCAMRWGVALHLYSQDEYFLHDALLAQVEAEEPIEIPLWKRDGSIGDFALIDGADLEEVDAYRWFWDGMYPATKVGDKNVRLHRFLMKPDDGLEVDHINRDRLDNRRSNLRVVTHSLNGKNVGSQGGTSKYRGVVWDKARSKWRAQARRNYRMVYLGRYDSEEEAAKVVEQFWTQVIQEDSGSDAGSAPTKSAEPKGSEASRAEDVPSPTPPEVQVNA